MLKVIDAAGAPTVKTIPMRDMKPLQVGYAQQNGRDGRLVMRTADSAEFEVIRLTDAARDGCWTSPNPLAVRLLEEGERVTVELFN